MNLIFAGKIYEEAILKASETGADRHGVNKIVAEPRANVVTEPHANVVAEPRANVVRNQRKCFNCVVHYVLLIDEIDIEKNMQRLWS